MDTKFYNMPEADNPIVYISLIRTEDLPDEVRSQLGDLGSSIPSVAPTASGWRWWPTRSWPSPWRASTISTRSACTDPECCKRSIG